MENDYLRIKKSDDFHALVTRFVEFVLLVRLQIICYSSKTGCKGKNPD